jgi:Zn-dependent protease
MLGGGASLQLARVLGIRIGVHASWFLALFLFIFVLSGSFQDVLGGSDTEAYLVAVASSLLFFVSVILHELGHALVARREGLGIAGIDLWFFGGVARLQGEERTPGQELRVAAAGPAVTLLVIGACVGAGAALGGLGAFRDAALLDADARITPGLLLVSWLATINVALLALNLVPAFPLDGARMLRAIVWRVTGDRSRGTRLTGLIGEGFGYLLMGLGVFMLLAGGWGLTGPWLLVLGFFIRGGARAAARPNPLATRLGAVRVADIMDAEPVAIPAEISAVRADDEFFARYRFPWFAVVEGGDRFLGVVRAEAVRGALEGGAPARPVGDLADGAPDWRIPADATLDALLRSEPLRRHGAQFAVDEDGRLRGVVTVDQVRRALSGAARPA